jgi:hypothetical protein
MLMSIQSPYRREDITERGHELYEAEIRSQVEADNMGKGKVDRSVWKMDNVLRGQQNPR